MKLLLSLTLIWALSSTGGALDCQTCTNQSCYSIVSQACPSGMCVTAAIQGLLSGFPYQHTFKTCAPSSVCPETGNQTISVSLGLNSGLISVSCCDTDDCNIDNLTYPVSPAANGLQCYTCPSFTFDCSVPTQCVGTQDHCIGLNVTSGSITLPAYGCASANLLATADGLQSMATFLELNVNVTSEPDFCNTTLCNNRLAMNTATATPNSMTAAIVTATTMTTADACCIRPGMVNLLIGLLIFTLY